MIIRTSSQMCKANIRAKIPVDGYLPWCSVHLSCTYLKKAGFATITWNTQKIRVRLPICNLYGFTSFIKIKSHLIFISLYTVFHSHVRPVWDKQEQFVWGCWTNTYCHTNVSAETYIVISPVESALDSHSMSRSLKGRRMRRTPGERSMALSGYIKWCVVRFPTYCS